MSLSFVVTGVAWLWLFTPGNFPADPTGVNLLLHRMGLDFLQSAWITDTKVVPDWYPDWSKTRIGIPLAMIPVAFAAIWQMSGFTMAMYLAGLRGIPEELREAARVDGASEWQVFRRITFPLLRPITLSAVIILGHISLKIFDLILTMTGGGPGNATDVPGVYMYDITFNSNKIAQGAAVAMVMLLLVAFLIVPYLIYNAQTEVER
jgi:glucose/mannose transport system permease protein